jgi:hypothetical protein
MSEARAGRTTEPTEPPDPNAPRRCKGCERLLFVHPDGKRHLAAMPLPHDETVCEAAHTEPRRGAVYDRRAAHVLPVRKTLPQRRRGERRDTWRSRQGLL